MDEGGLLRVAARAIERDWFGEAGAMLRLDGVERAQRWSVEEVLPRGATRPARAEALHDDAEVHTVAPEAPLRERVPDEGGYRLAAQRALERLPPALAERTRAVLAAWEQASEGPVDYRIRLFEEDVACVSDTDGARYWIGLDQARLFARREPTRRSVRAVAVLVALLAVVGLLSVLAAMVLFGKGEPAALTSLLGALVAWGAAAGLLVVVSRRRR